MTWVPSSINRVYSLIYPSSVSVSYAYAAGLVLSLMGFWNSVIYIATTRAACKSLAVGLCQRIGRGGGGGRMVIGDGEGREGLARRRGRGRESWGDSLEGLAGERGIEREGRGFNGGFI